MKKKVLGLLLAVLSIFVLVACSSENMDGTYYEFYRTENGLIVSKLYPVKISDTTLVGPYNDDTYTINKENKTLVGEGEIFEYTFENDAITFDEHSYVRADSERYKTFIKNGAEISD